MNKIQMLATVIPIICLLTFSFFLIGARPAMAAPTAKKAILVVSFGTTHQDTFQKTIRASEIRIQSAFLDYEVRRAFTSRIVAQRMSERTGVKIDNEIEALERLGIEGYTEVIVQPLHIVGGEEFEKVRAAVKRFEKSFDKISLGRPLLYYMGQEEHPNDYEIAIKAVSTQFPKLKKNEAIVFMGHGGIHPANAAYAALQMKFDDLGFKNTYIYTVESYPELDDVIGKLKSGKVKKVILMPFMLVAGDHAKNDMAGDEEDSAKSILTKAGFQVEVYVHGLGENPAVQDIYVEHIRDAIAGEEE